MPRSAQGAAEPSLRSVFDSQPADRAPARRRLALIADSASEVIAGQALLIREARMRGHELFCFTARDSEAFRALSALGVEPMALPAAGRDKHDVRELALALTSLSPDVVMALSWPSARLGIAAAARARVGHIVAAFPELAQALAPGKGGARLRRDCAGLLSHCHAAIVPGLDRDPVLEGRSLMPPELEPVFIAGHGVDLARMTHVPLASLNKGMVFLAIAYPGSEDGIAAYCECARRLQEKRGNAIYLTVSPPEADPSAELLRLMKAHRGIVRYLGPREDIQRLLARAHAVVFPGETPLLPHEIGHAVAIGRPVVSADVAARRQAVEHEVNGVRVPAGDVEALVSTILNLLRRPDLIPRYAKESRRIATTRLDLDAVVETTLAALRL